MVSGNQLTLSSILIVASIKLYVCATSVKNLQFFFKAFPLYPSISQFTLSRHFSDNATKWNLREFLEFKNGIHELIGHLKVEIEARVSASVEQGSDQSFHRGQCIHWLKGPRDVFAGTSRKFIRVAM